MRRDPKHIVTAAALVRGPDNHVLMMQHPKRGWEFPGGQVEEGETILAALAREIMEETGVSAKIGPLVGVYSNISTPAKVHFGFLADYVDGVLTTSEESLETAWVMREGVLEKVSHPAIRGRMRDMLHFDGRVIYRVYSTAPYTVIAEHDLTAPGDWHAVDIDTGLGD